MSNNNGRESVKRDFFFTFTANEFFFIEKWPTVIILMVSEIVVFIMSPMIIIHFVLNKKFY